MVGVGMGLKEHPVPVPCHGTPSTRAGGSASLSEWYPEAAEREDAKRAEHPKGIPSFPLSVFGLYLKDRAAVNFCLSVIPLSTEKYVSECEKEGV